MSPAVLYDITLLQCYNSYNDAPLPDIEWNPSLQFFSFHISPSLESFPDSHRMLLQELVYSPSEIILQLQFAGFLSHNPDSKKVDPSHIQLRLYDLQSPHHLQIQSTDDLDRLSLVI